MTPDVRPISEDDLHAYVDDRLNAERQASVEAYLQAHPDVAARVDGWRAARDMLKRSLDPVTEEPVPAALNVSRLAAAGRRRSLAPWRIAAALVLGVGLGAGGGWMVRGRQSTPTGGIAVLAAQAADAHRAFAGDLVHPVEFTATELPAALGWIDRRVGRPVAPPDLSGAGYRLMGGRVLATPQGVACLFMYDDDRGTRISVVMRPMRDSETDVPIRAVSVDGTFGSVWARGGLGVSVVSSKPLPKLTELSDQVREDLTGS